MHSQHAFTMQKVKSGSHLISYAFTTVLELFPLRVRASYSKVWSPNCEARIKCVVWNNVRSRLISVQRETTWDPGRWKAFSFIH